MSSIHSIASDRSSTVSSSATVPLIEHKNAQTGGLPRVSWAPFSKTVMTVQQATRKGFHALQATGSKAAVHLKISHANSGPTGGYIKSQENKEFARKLDKLHRSIKSDPSTYNRDEVLNVATELLQPDCKKTQALRVVTTALAKLDATKKEDREFGDQILKVLADRVSKPNSSTYATGLKYIHEKTVVKLIVRNAPAFSPADSGEMVAKLFAANLKSSSGMREYDVQGALVRHLAKNLDAYPVAARMKIAMAVLENLHTLSAKPPAGHNSTLHRLPAAVSYAASGAVGLGSATAGIITTAGAATALTSAIIWPLGIAFGAGAAAAIGFATYQKVRNRFRDSIQDRAFADIALPTVSNAMTKDQKTGSSEQMSREQAVQHFATMRNAAEGLEAKYRKGMDEIFEALEPGVKTEIAMEQARMKSGA